MNRDEDNATGKKRLPADERLRSEPLGGSDSGAGVRRERPEFRPVTGAGAEPAPSVPPPFFKIANGSGTRRGPSYPAWEKPPTPYDYPRLRGREARKPMWIPWPPVLAAIGVALLLFVFVVLPALTGHGGNVAVASPSASPVASHFISPSPSSLASPSIAPPSSVDSGSSGSPVPQASYQQYKVVAGDTVTKIAKKFGLKSSELLLANPNLVPPYTLKIGSYLNIPQPAQPTSAAPTPAGSPRPS